MNPLREKGKSRSPAVVHLFFHFVKGRVQASFLSAANGCSNILQQWQTRLKRKKKKSGGGKKKKLSSKSTFTFAPTANTEVDQRKKGKKTDFPLSKDFFPRYFFALLTETRPKIAKNTGSQK